MTADVEPDVLKALVVRTWRGVAIYLDDRDAVVLWTPEHGWTVRIPSVDIVWPAPGLTPVTRQAEAELIARQWAARRPWEDR